MPKEDYLDPRWQKFRLQRLEQSHWKCDSCNTCEQTLHVHHRFYIPGRKPWQYPLQLTQVLCAECHQIAHDFASDYETFESDFWEDLLAIIFAVEKTHRNTKSIRKEMLEAIDQLVR